MQVANRLGGIEEYYFSKKLREIETLNQQGKKIINLGIGSPDMPPHPSVIATLSTQALLPHIHGYSSYKGIASLRESIANWYQQWYRVTLDPQKEIYPLIGSKEGIVHICMTYLNPGDKVLIPNPGYPTYQSAVKLAGGICVPYILNEKNNWYPQWDVLEDSDLTKVKIMWVNYPHMPTGQPASMKQFERMVDFAKKHQILICHDNPYSFILNSHPLSLLEVDGAKEVAIELNSLSKSHNMAGWRVGMLLSNSEKIDQVMQFKSNMDSGMFTAIQEATAQALTLDKEWFNSLNNIYHKRRTHAFAILTALKTNFQTNQTGMFVWAKIPASYKDSYDMCDNILYNANVFITPGGIFGNEGDAYIRISLCGEETKFIEALQRIQQI